MDLIGSHGQTIYHHSGVAGARRATLQLGDGDIIAVRTGCYVISDFRARDIAAGGEGAPLSPIADTILFASEQSLGSHAEGRFSILAGLPISQCLTLIHTRVFGFDTGPANAPLDRWHAIYLAVSSHVIKTGDLPGQGELTKSSSANC